MLKKHAFEHTIFFTWMISVNTLFESDVGK